MNNTPFRPSHLIFCGHDRLEAYPLLNATNVNRIHLHNWSPFLPKTIQHYVEKVRNTLSLSPAFMV